MIVNSANKKDRYGKGVDRRHIVARNEGLFVAYEHIGEIALGDVTVTKSYIIRGFDRSRSGSILQKSSPKMSVQY